MAVMYVNIVFLLSLNKLAVGRSNLNVLVYHKVHSTEKKVFFF
jgi:hypothetical protein